MASGAPAAYRRTVIGQLNKIAKHKLVLRENLFDAAQNIDDLGAVAAQLGLLAEVLIKFAQDLRLLSSGPKGGLGEIVLPAVMEGSSFYPGKINPVVPETLLQCCFQVLGCERAARLALERGELNLNIFEGAAAINIMDAMEMLTRARRELHQIVPGGDRRQRRAMPHARITCAQRRNISMSEWKTDYVPGAPRIAIDHRRQRAAGVVHARNRRQSHQLARSASGRSAKNFTPHLGMREVMAPATTMMARSTSPISATTSFACSIISGLRARISSVSRWEV